MNKFKKSDLYFIFPITLFLFFWEIIVRLGIAREAFFSMPSKIFVSIFTLFKTGFIWPHLLLSLKTYFGGLLLAIIVGLTLGLVIGYYKSLFKFFRPYIFTLSSLPMVAMIPLIIIWFGFDIKGRMFMVFLMSLMPILISVTDGVQNTTKKLFEMSKSFGANNFFIVRSVIFFETLPFLFSSMRSAIGRGMVGLLLAELYGYGRGLGHLISSFGNTFQTTKLLSVLFIILFISLTSQGAVSIIEKKILFWRK